MVSETDSPDGQFRLGILLGVSAFLALFLAALIPAVFSPHPRHITAYLGGREFHLEVADTPFLRARGLSGRTHLAETSGMLFFFDAVERPTFWMKGMEIPLDILWVREGTIRGIVSRAEPPNPGVPDEATPRFPAPEAVDAVIEIRAGSAEELGLKPGQAVRILLP